MRGLCLASLLSAVLIGRGAPSTEADEHLAGHWKLAGDCRDHSGNGNHGRNHGTDLAAPGPDGRPGGSARFDGRADFIEIAAGRSLARSTKDFSIAVWVHTSQDLDDVLGDIVSQYDPASRRGFSLSIKNAAGVTSSQANYRNVHFGIDSGQLEPQWTDHGRPGDAVLIFALAVHRGQLYAGTCESGGDQAGHVYRLEGGTKWVDCRIPARCNAVSSLAVFRGQLYAGVSRYRLAGSALAESENPHLGGKVYRYDGGQNWLDCGQLPDTEAIGGMVVYRGALYASSLYRPAGFFRYEGERSWQSCGTPGGKRVEALCVFNAHLFASGYDEGHVYRYDGSSWTDCGPLGENTQTYSFAIHEGGLYAGTWPSGKVFRYAGDHDWQDTGRLGEELEVMGMAVHNGKLYAGTLPLAAVYRFDGPARWTSTGRLDLTPHVKYRRAWTMAEYQGRLFCGTLPSGRVLSIAAGTSVTCDDELAHGWRHLATTKHGGRLKLYVDGKLVATSTSYDPTAYELSNDQPLKIGFGPHDYFNGSLCDLRIYDRALGDAEVADLAGR